MSEQAEMFYSEWYTNEDAEQTEQPKREFIVTLDLENADIEGSIPITNTEPIVRCRDCKHFTPKGTHKFENGKVNDDYCDYVRGWMLQITPDGFCAWGERVE